MSPIIKIDTVLKYHDRANIYKKQFVLLAQPAHIMRSRVYETVRRPAVCPSFSPSVRLSVHGSKSSTAGLLLWARQAGDIDRLPQQRRANAGSATLSAYVDS